MSIFKKYQYWVDSGKYSAIQKFFTIFVGLISFMLLTRVLGPGGGFGVWGLFLVISATAETARSALIRNAFIRHTHQTTDVEEQASLQSAAFMLNFLVSLVMGIIIVLCLYPVTHWLHSPELSMMLRWYAVTIVISCFFSHFEMLLNTKMDFKGICYLYCVRQALLLALILACFIFHVNIALWILALFYLLSMIAGILTGWYFCRNYISWNFKSYKNSVGRLWHYGKFVFGTNVSANLFRSTDNFMAFKNFGDGGASQYNASYRISNLIDLPSQVMSDLMFPKAAKLADTETASVRNMYERTVGAILVFSFPALLFVICFPDLLLLVLAGKAFVSAAPILRITAFFGFTLPFIKQFGTIMDATGHPHLNFRVMLLSVFLNIINNWIGIQLFGLIGAAVGTACTYFIIFILTQYLLHKKFGIQWMNTFRNMVKLYGELFMTARGMFHRTRTSN